MRSNYLLRPVLAASALTLLLLSSGSAQESRATLSGTLTIQVDQVSPARSSNLTNVDTRTPSTAETNQSGQYRFLFLNPGKYRLTRRTQRISYVRSRRH